MKRWFLRGEEVGRGMVCGVLEDEREESAKDGLVEFESGIEKRGNVCEMFQGIRGLGYGMLCVPWLEKLNPPLRAQVHRAAIFSLIHTIQCLDVFRR